MTADLRWATRHIIVACTSDKRWFDLDAVRTEHKLPDPYATVKADGSRYTRRRKGAIPEGMGTDAKGEGSTAANNPAGAPPLDWCEDDFTDEPVQHERHEGMTARLLVGDVRTRISEIPDGSIDLVCTSPPFLALRKYGDNSDAEMGSEANPAAFIDALLELCAEFRRVLAPHGSIAIELGDTYSGSGGQGDWDHIREGGTRSSGLFYRQSRLPGWPLSKSLAGIPEAFMLSLAYGWNVLHRNPPDSPAGRWRVRNVIVWARPNPPVGQLADKVRPATSYITVACTSSTRWFDLDAVREPFKSPLTHQTTAYDGSGHKAKIGLSTDNLTIRQMTHDGAPPLDWWEDDDPTGHATLVLPTQPYPGAHYATWPPTLAKRLIEMMCPLRVCTVCGEPSRRIVGDAEYLDDGRGNTGAHREGANSGSATGSMLGQRHATRVAPTLGWTECACRCEICYAAFANLLIPWPSCTHKWRKGMVLDPFAGSGTTLDVAIGNGRDATGIELYPSNCDLIADRLGMFLEVVA